jgi:hypothetical protein
MKYALLIYGNEAGYATATQEDIQVEAQAYFAFNADVEKRGLKLWGEALQPTTTATTVRNPNSKVLTTDGPFAETKEQLAGFYVIDCKDLDEAIAFAAKIPGSKHGSIEVRPVAQY